MEEREARPGASPTHPPAHLPCCPPAHPPAHPHTFSAGSTPWLFSSSNTRSVMVCASALVHLLKERDLCVGWWFLKYTI